MEGLRILLLASSIGATMAGTLYAGVQAERTHSSQEVAAAEALSPVPQTVLIPEVEALEPPAPDIAQGAAAPDHDELDRLNEIDVQNAVASGVDAEDIVLDSGLRIGALTRVELNEVAESSRPPGRRGRRAPPRPPPGPRLHPNPGQHSVLTARRMIAQNELIQGSCYAYLSEVYSRAAIAAGGSAPSCTARSAKAPMRTSA